ncbi:MAG: voltage-gated chloride channel family protein [Bacteroidales bacterium]
MPEINHECMGGLFTFLKENIHVQLIIYLFKWLLICLLVGACVGTASAGFLAALQLATAWREAHTWIIALLPIGGLIIGIMYFYWGKEVVKGNNQLLEEFHAPKKIIPFRMAPLVLIGTIITHFFGGSAGREGTAVQMGGAIADQFTRLFGFHRRDRQIILICGISAGFASVFGTPLAGAVFALEVMVIGRMRYEALVPSFLIAAISNYVCTAWGASHSHYAVNLVPEYTLPNLLYALLAGVLFGLTAILFAKSTQLWSKLFSRYIQWAPLRPFVGGILLAVVIFSFGAYRYTGLGLPVIQSAFTENLPSHDFIVKLLFTSFTLGVGFKGGEVTPLFFIGATLGNALSFFIPLPMALLAAMGFVAVFSGATNTPIACTLMGIELFGIESGLFIALSCVTAYLFSGHSSIYSAQIIGSPKHRILLRDKGETIRKTME